MLYWFRTPPGVKVGRAALDEDAIRRIEQINPGIEFDWTRILKGQGAPPTESRPQAEVRRQRSDNRRPPPPPPPPRAVQPSVAVAAASEEVRPVDVASVSPVAVPVESDVPTPAHGKLGSEGVQRLRARYAEILVRISERTADPARQGELKAQADRLNPDAWVTDDEVVQGLEEYESVFASLREVVGQQRRRRRRGRGPRPGGDVRTGADGSASPTAAEPFDSPDGTEDES